MLTVRNLIFIVLSLFNFYSYAVETQTSPTADKKELQEEITQSGVAAQKFLELIDAGRYEQAWQQASEITHERVKKEKDWVKILKKTREPLGSVNKRTILDIRIAKDPRNMPAGTYMVYFYNTDFAQKAVAYELITLYLQNGEWKVVTYQVD